MYQEKTIFLFWKARPDMKAKIIAEFSESFGHYKEYSGFFDHNDVGVPLSISVALGQGALTEKGKEVIDETWLVLCQLLKADPDAEFGALQEMVPFISGPNSIAGLGIENGTSSASEIVGASVTNLGHQTSIKEKVNIIDQFISEYIDQDQFMEDNARGIALAEASWQELIDLTESGASIVNETWINLCALFGVDPTEEYLELADLEDEEV
jgi:hypothetical protein